MKLVTKYQISSINSCWEKCDEKWAYMFNVYKNQQSRQTGSRNLMGLKTLPTIWYTYMKLVTKYQIPAINSCWEKCVEKYLGLTEGQTDEQRKNSIPPPTSGSGGAINSCWEKCDEKWAYMFNVLKNQQSRQTGSRNLTGPKTLPTIWYTYMKLVTKYQIPAINSYWEKCDENFLDGRKDRQTERGKTVYPTSSFGEWGYNYLKISESNVFWWNITESGKLQKRKVIIYK
jgi:hypothetical protein